MPRRLVWTTMTTLDGHTARSDARSDWSEIDWHRVDDELADDVAELLTDAAAVMMGRATYLGFAEFWPQAGGPDSTHAENVIGPHMERLPKIVLSRSLKNAPWGPATILRDPNEVRALKAQSGKDIVYLAGPTAAATLLEHDLIDEFHFHLHPVAIGRGKPLFPALSRDLKLELIEAKPRASGVVTLRYARG